VVDSGIWRAKVSPEMFLMKTCIVGSGSVEDAREETGESEESDETLLDRMMAVDVMMRSVQRNVN